MDTLTGEATLPFSFLPHLYECTGRAIPLALALVAWARTKCKSFRLKFYVMGKVQSGEISCMWTSLGAFLFNGVQLLKERICSQIKPLLKWWLNHDDV